LSDEKITELSSLVITNYTAGLADFLDTLYSRTKVYKLCIPYPKNSDESSALRLVSRVCEAHGVKIITYPENDLISIGAAEFACTYRQPYGEDVKFTYSVLFKDKFYTYISRGMLDFETRYYAERVLGESSAIVLGSYGQTDAAPLTFRYKLPGLSKLVVNNTYVTLDTNYLDYYQSRGAYVYILKNKVRLD
ncbi:MAG: hypothetical protein IIX96_01640, partial [Clostridia bacterium]|nr:hypothetical protein [Clostridia bacterium]